MKRCKKQMPVNKFILVDDFSRYKYKYPLDIIVTVTENAMQLLTFVKHVPKNDIKCIRLWWLTSVIPPLLLKYCG